MKPVLINSIGLIFDVVGALMIWKYVPALFKEDRDGNITPTDIWENKRKIFLSEFGIFLIAIGFLLQFISGMIPLLK